MSTETLLTPEAAQALRHLSAGKIRSALNRTLATFDATPDEKLDYKPSETAKSIRELVAHAAEGNFYVGSALGLTIEKDGPSDREALIRRLTDTTEQVIAAIEGLTDEQVSGSIDFFGHPMPMTAFMLVDEYHISRHAGQIDYIQTIYGDLEDHS